MTMPDMIFRNTEYYATYVASTYEKIDQLSVKYGIKVRPLAWAFMFPGERCFGGTRTFSTQGIDKAVFNMFKIYGTLGDEKLSFTSDKAETLDFLNEPDIGTKNHSQYTGEGEETDVSGFAVKGKNGETQIIIYSHNNDREKEETQEITVCVNGLCGTEKRSCSITGSMLSIRIRMQSGYVRASRCSRKVCSMMQSRPEMVWKSWKTIRPLR